MKRMDTTQPVPVSATSDGVSVHRFTHGLCPRGRSRFSTSLLMWRCLWGVAELSVLLAHTLLR